MKVNYEKREKRRGDGFPVGAPAGRARSEKGRTAEYLPQIGKGALVAWTSGPRRAEEGGQQNWKMRGPGGPRYESLVSHSVVPHARDLPWRGNSLRRSGQPEEGWLSNRDYLEIVNIVNIVFDSGKSAN